MKTRAPGKYPSSVSKMLIKKLMLQPVRKNTPNGGSMTAHPTEQQSRHRPIVAYVLGSPLGTPVAWRCRVLLLPTAQAKGLEQRGPRSGVFAAALSCESRVRREADDCTQQRCPTGRPASHSSQRRQTRAWKGHSHMTRMNAIPRKWATCMWCEVGIRGTLGQRQISPNSLHCCRLASGVRLCRQYALFITHN